MNARLITYLHTDGTLGVRVENKLADTTTSVDVDGAVLLSSTGNIGDTRSIGNSGLSMTPDEHVGRLVVITGGPLNGEVRRVKTNTATLLTYEDDDPDLLFGFDDPFDVRDNPGQGFVEVADFAGIHVDDKIVFDQGVGGKEETVTVISVRITGGTTREVEANFIRIHFSGATVKGQVAYTFDDTNVLYREGFGPAVEGTEVSVAEVANSYSAEHANENREYTQDGGEIVNAQFANLLRAKTIRQLPVDGIPNSDTFVRAAKLQFLKTLRTPDNKSANTILRVTTTVKGVQVKIGDIVDVNLTDHTWANGRYRIIGIRPTGNPVAHENIQFSLAGVDESWYDVVNGQIVPATSFTPPDRSPLPPGCTPDPIPRYPGPGSPHEPRFGPTFV